MLYLGSNHKKRKSITSAKELQSNVIDLVVPIDDIKYFFSSKKRSNIDIKVNLNDDEVNSNRIIGKNLIETLELNAKFIFKIVRFVVFYILGILFYKTYEDLSLLDSIYFITTTITTLGYGNIAPKTPGGKIFTSFYMYIGIVLCFSVIGDVFHFLVELLKKPYKIKHRKRRTKLQVLIRSTLNCIMWIFILYLIPIIGGLIFSHIENWTFYDGFYFATITASSVGYGDLVLQKDSSVRFNILYILVSVSLTAICLKKISSFKRHLDNAELHESIDSIKFDEALLKAISSSRGKPTVVVLDQLNKIKKSFSENSKEINEKIENGKSIPSSLQPNSDEIDPDFLKTLEPSEYRDISLKLHKNDAISRSDYVLHMLQLEGKIFPTDILPWIDKFQLYDLDNDDYLTKEDVNEFNRLRDIRSVSRISQSFPNQYLKKVINQPGEEPNSFHPYNTNEIDVNEIKFSRSLSVLRDEFIDENNQTESLPIYKQVFKEISDIFLETIGLKKRNTTNASDMLFEGVDPQQHLNILAKRHNSINGPSVELRSFQVSPLQKDHSIITSDFDEENGQRMSDSD